MSPTPGPPVRYNPVCACGHTYYRTAQAICDWVNAHQRHKNKNAVAAAQGSAA